MLSNLDSVCGTESLISPLSFFDAAFSAVLILISVPLNLLILGAIIKYRHLLHRSFYLIIGNIAVADLMTSLITSSLSVSFHIKEGLGFTSDEVKLEIQTLHYTLFVTNGVSVLSMAILSCDRLGVLLNPFIYYEKMTRHKMTFLLVFTWLVSSGLSIGYFFIGFIRYLAIFALTTVVLTTVVMVVTMFIFHKRLAESKRAELGQDNPMGPKEVKDSIQEKHKRRTIQNFTQMDRRITTTFLWMLVLFLINYIPAVTMIIYMNFCVNCSCTFVHVMRDIVVLSVLSSGLWRAINFLIRLTALKEAVKTMIEARRKKQQQGFDFIL